MRGREPELEQIRRLYSASSARLVTITGLGGVGKTSLALLVAHAVATAEAGVLVAFCELEHLTDPNAVGPTIAQSLGVPNLADIPAEQALFLILDNFEHVRAAATTISGMLKRLPRLQVLITSRAALDLRIEHRFPLDGLPCPPVGHETPLDELTTYPAIAMFVDCAKRADPGFQINVRTAPRVVELCQLVEGLPLAIEILAAQVRRRGLEAIAPEITSQLEAANLADSPQRQQSMSAALSWSEGLLSLPARKVYRRLSLSTNAIGGSERSALMLDDLSGAEVEGAIDELLQSSLVTRTKDGELAMHPAAAAFGQKRLEAAGETELVVARVVDEFFAWSQSIPLDPGVEDASILTRADWRRAVSALFLSSDCTDQDLRLKGGTAMQRLFPYVSDVLKEYWASVVPPMAKLISQNRDARLPTLSAAFEQFIFDTLEFGEPDDEDDNDTLREAWEFARESRNTALAIAALGLLRDRSALYSLVAPDDWDSWVAQQILNEGRDAASAAGAFTLETRLIQNVLDEDFDRADFEYLMAIAQAAIVIDQTGSGSDARSFTICLAGMTALAYHLDEIELLLELLRWNIPPEADDTARDYVVAERDGIWVRLSLALGDVAGAQSRDKLIALAFQWVERQLKQGQPRRTLLLLGALAGELTEPGDIARRGELEYIAGESVDPEETARALEEGRLRGWFQSMVDSYPLSGEW